MDKFRVKALVASMESPEVSEDLLIQPDLNCPLSVAMEDADVAKAILQVAAVAAIATALGYAIGRLIGWMAGNITGSSGGSSISSSASSASRHIDSGVSRAENYSSSFTRKTVTITLNGWAVYCSINHLDPERQLATVAKACQGLEQWVFAQGRALADALSEGSSDSKKYRLDPHLAQSLTTNLRHNFNNLIFNATATESPGRYAQNVLSKLHSDIKNSSNTIHMTQEQVLEMLRKMKESVNKLASAAPEIESEFKKSENELNILRTQLEKMKSDSESLTPECKAEANRTRSEVLAGINGLATGIHLVRDLFSNARTNFDAAERALRESKN